MKKWKQFLILYIPIHIGTYYLWIYFSEKNVSEPLLGANAFSFLGPFVSAVFLFMVWKKASKAFRPFWFWMFLSAFGYTMAEGIWAYYELLAKATMPFPGWRDLFYLLSPVCQLIATFLLVGKKYPVQGMRLFFNILMTMTVATTLFWVFIIEPMLNLAGTSFFSKTVSFFYPVATLGLLFGAVNMFFLLVSFSKSKIIFWLMVQSTLKIYADSAYMYLTIKGIHVSSAFYDPVWTLSQLLVLFVALNYKELEETQPGSKKQKPDRESRVISGLRLLTPYVSAVSLFIITINHFGQVDALVVGCAISMLLIVLILLENDILLRKMSGSTKELEQVVRQRTEELEETLGKVEYLAYHDTLTGLPNRRFFEEKLMEGLERSAQTNLMAAVLYLDLNRFKQINDNLGHHVGDLLLQEVSRRLRSSVRNVDTLSRQGGDEFSILLEDIKDAEEVMQIAKQINEAVLKPFCIDGKEIYTSTSIGIALYPNHSAQPDELIKFADTAMYHTKENKKNGFSLYEPVMLEALFDYAKLEADLWKAIEKNELLLHYQPKVNIETSELIGVEALVRWQHAQLGLISPAKFIPIAEKTGLIVPIGEWVLIEACRQLKTWRQAGFENLRLSVNLSPHQFLNNDLTKTVNRALHISGIEPECLELEITESAAVALDKEFFQTIKELREKGIQIAIDDFGTGYSSVSYLKMFPIDVIKIDQTFIKDMFLNEKNKLLLAGLIALGKNLGCRMIAEGVESEKHLSFLKEIQCDDIQGYLFSKPLPSLEIEAWMRAQTSLASKKEFV